MSVFLLQISLKLAKQLLKYMKWDMRTDVSVFYTQINELIKKIQVYKGFWESNQTENVTKPWLNW